jgi:hypothetical protein
MPEQTLSPTDFEFTEGGELVVHWRMAAGRAGERQGGAGERSATAEQPTPVALGRSDATMDDAL